MTTANQMQVGGDHYRNDQDGCQHWDFMLANYGCSYLVGCATKYIVRWRKKNGIQDLKKASHYVMKMQEAAADNLISPLPDRTKIPLGTFFEANEVEDWERDIVSRITNWFTVEDLRHVGILIKEKIFAESN